jgi:hypothetical protein
MRRSGYNRHNLDYVEHVGMRENQFILVSPGPPWDIAWHDCHEIVKIAHL